MPKRSPRPSLRALAIAGILACAAPALAHAAPLDAPSRPGAGAAPLRGSALRLIAPNLVVVVLGVTWLGLMARRHRRPR